MKDLDFNEDKVLAKDFLSNFAEADGEAKYMNIPQDVANHKIRAVQIDIEDLSNDLDEGFLRRVIENTRRYFGIFVGAIDELLPEPTEVFHDDDHDILMTQRARDGTNNADGSDPHLKMPPEIKRYYEVYIRAPSKGRPLTIREVKASYIGQLVRVSGIVTCCSDVKPLMQVAVYKCEECGYEIYQAKIQELAEHVPKGHLPWSMTVHLRGEMTRMVGVHVDFIVAEIPKVDSMKFLSIALQPFPPSQHHIAWQETLQCPLHNKL